MSSIQQQSPFGRSGVWERLPVEFYARPALTVARDLLGRYLVRRLGNATVAGRIVEVEAYRGSDDPASHAYRGRTPRNEVMFWEGGHLYVYFTYGMHYCANIVTGAEGLPGAVLVRAVEPVLGIEIMRLSRPGARDDHQLTNGPAKLCEALRISRNDNGSSLNGPAIFLTRGVPLAKTLRSRSIRLGIKNGREKQWRFFERDNPWVTRTPGRSRRS